jgi:hypothetical protein
MDNSANKSVTSPKPKLLDQVRATMQTEEAYIYWIQGGIF